MSRAISLRQCRKCSVAYEYPGFRRGTGSTRAHYCSTACEEAWIAEKRHVRKAHSIKISALDSLFSDVVRLRAGLKCERCGKQFEGLSGGLHCSHFIGRAEPRTRYDFDNCDSLCYGCHTFFETRKAIEYRLFKIGKLGERRYLALTARLQEPWRPRRETEKAALKAELMAERADLLGRLVG